MRSFCCLLTASVFLPLVSLADSADLKQSASDSIARQSQELIQVSDAVWAFAETALLEFQSAAVLSDYAENQGFRVQRDLAGMPTAFIAEYGEGRPIIGILGEYDALPRLSQTTATTREELEPGAGGHGCGHNLFGAGSLGAATAIKQLIDSGEIEGTVRFYGTPAEEAIGGKVYLVRDGYFNDLDAVLSWHPDAYNKVDVSGSQAMVETLVSFHGRSAHAAYDPWNGRSALDGVELFTHSLNLWREHVPTDTRIHYSIANGGGAPNVVPAEASAVVWVRARELEQVMRLYERMQAMAAGSALAANVEAEVILLSATYSMLPNKTLAQIAHANMLALGPREYSKQDFTFGREIQRAMGVPESDLKTAIQPLDLNPSEISGGSTDVADVSWIVPTIGISVGTAPADIPWHSWGVVASSGSSVGHNGMLFAARVLANTAIDLFTDEQTLREVQAEFARVTDGFEYRYYISDGPPPESPMSQ